MTFLAQESPKRQQQVVAWTWGILLLLAIADFFLLRTSNVALSPKTLFVTLSVFALLALLSAFYHYMRKDFGIYIVMQMTNQLVVGTLLLAILSYLGAWLNYPFIDRQLSLLDNIRHMEWRSYVSAVNNCPVLPYIYMFCYQVTGPEIPLLLVILFLLKRYASLQRFTVAFLGSGFITILLATFWPARVAYEYYGITAATFPHIAINESLHYLTDYYAIRSHTLSVLPTAFEGLVEFPSFHSTIAVLMIAAARNLRYPPLRWALIIINSIMLLSTPVEGGHYFIDTIAGAALGIVTVLLVGRIIPCEKAVKF